VTSPVYIANGVSVEREVTVALQNDLISDKIANGIRVQRKVTVKLKKKSR
jgi:hypothetical protein